MQQWYHLIPKNTGLSLFAWIAFCILPFYFIFRFSSVNEIFIGVFLTLLFFVSYRLAFIKKGWMLYVSISIEILINVGMTLYFGYVYFSLFLAFFIGNIRNKAGFISLYVVHLVLTIIAVLFGFFLQTEIFLTQLPFILLTVIGVILLPVNLYSRNKQEKLVNQLEDAEEQIAALRVVEERERIARDLHDTLGQKLSLIGLKSELAGKLVYKNPDAAALELQDIHQTARLTLKEVRELVADMKGTRLKDEIIRVKQLLTSAEITYNMDEEELLSEKPVLVENAFSMCLKEAVTNVVKHSEAENCWIQFQELDDVWMLIIQDDGKGFDLEDYTEGNGMTGMRERLDFVNGSVEVDKERGACVTITIPRIIQSKEQENRT